MTAPLFGHRALAVVIAAWRRRAFIGLGPHDRQVGGGRLEEHRLGARLAQSPGLRFEPAADPGAGADREPVGE